MKRKRPSLGRRHQRRRRFWLWYRKAPVVVVEIHGLVADTYEAMRLYANAHLAQKEALPPFSELTITKLMSAFQYRITSDLRHFYAEAWSPNASLFHPQLAQVELVEDALKGLLHLSRYCWLALALPPDPDEAAIIKAWLHWQRVPYDRLEPTDSVAHYGTIPRLGGVITSNPLQALSCHEAGLPVILLPARYPAGLVEAKPLAHTILTYPSWRTYVKAVQPT